jgi:integrase
MKLIDDYVQWMEDSEYSPVTIENRRNFLIRLDAELPYGLARACTDELRAVLRRPEWGQGTRATYRATVEAFYRRAFDVRDPWLDGENPMLWMPERPRMPDGESREVTDEELAEVLGRAREPFRLWALIAAYQALRCCEIARLDREHVKETTLRVMRGKGGRPRRHATDSYVWEAVKDLPPGPLAVDWRTGERATAHFVSTRFANHCRYSLHMPGVSLHRLRHWCGVHVQEEYRDIRVTQEVLGHRKLSSTQIYTRATVEQQRKACATLPRLAG